MRQMAAPLKPWNTPAMRAAIAHRLCQPPECGGSLRPWAPLIVPARLDKPTLEILLAALVEIDMNYLREHPGTPPIYSSGIRYEAEPPGQEQWLSIPFVLMRRDMGLGADCEDLACWRVAELRLRLGENAHPIITDRRMPEGGHVYHIRVKRAKRTPSGAPWIEDPSALLGMNANWNSHSGQEAPTAVYTESVTAQNPHASGAWFESFIIDGERL